VTHDIEAVYAMTDPKPELAQGEKR
jgi:hypothetical protein